MSNVTWGMKSLKAGEYLYPPTKKPKLDDNEQAFFGVFPNHQGLGTKSKSTDLENIFFPPNI